MIAASGYHAGKFLIESELLDDSRRCPWCQFDGTRSRVLRLQQDPSVWLLACPRCHAMSSSHVATQAALEAYYASYYAGNRDNRVTCGSPRRHARHICQCLSLDAKPTDLRILDFGGGDGAIGHAAALELIKGGVARVDIVVIDHNSRLVTPAHAAIGLSHASSLEQLPEEQTFHLVMASAVLEHLTQPAEATRSLLGRLEPGGYLYARTPCVFPLLKLLNAARVRADFTFPAHFHDLGQDFWDNILSTMTLPADKWTLVRSRPSLVETGFREHPVRTVCAYCLKAPWWLLGRRYGLTGGWEVVIRRKSI
jgi:2-polyprenyl-3-methyl-5-hydroxy-6-metoxy-1,4-benzoquinol methylase